MERTSKAGAKKTSKDGRCRKPLIFALEPRIMFDGAAMADVVQRVADTPDATPDAAPDAAPDTQHEAPAPEVVRTVDPAQNGGRKEVAFVDTGVADYQTLVDGVRAGVEVVLIDAGQSGLDQMARWAETHGGYDAIHVLSHGSEGTLRLGADTITGANLADASVSADLAALGSALTADGDLLVYGCNVAGGETGQAFVAALADATGADVAASQDVTGAQAMGGDWDLESATSVLSTTGLSIARFNGLLLTTTTLTFAPNDGDSYNSFTDEIAHDGDGGSTDIAGIDIEIFAISDSAETQLTESGGLLAINNSGHWLGYPSSLGYSTVAVTSTGFYGMVIQSSDGTDFSMRGISITDWNGNTAVVTLKTYRDGNLVGTTTKAPAGWDSMAPVTITSIFNNIDKVVVYKAGSSVAINDIQIGDPIVPGPTTTVTLTGLSNDTGSSGTDWVTNAASQTISGTLSANLASGEKVQVSYDNGATWSDATNYTVGSSSWSTTTTLSGSDTFRARVSDGTTGGTAATHTYTLDTTTPGTPSGTVDLNATKDSGTSNSDNITNVTTPAFRVSLAGTSAVAGDTLELLLGGASLSTPRAQILTGTDITNGYVDFTIASGDLGADGVKTLTARVTDVAGNVGTAGGALAVTLDTTAPTDFALSSNTIMAAATGTNVTVGTLSATDSHSITYALATGNGSNDSGNGSFNVSGSSLRTNGALTAGDYNVYVRATDTAGNISYQALTITVNANAAPTVTGASAGQTVNDTATVSPFSGVTIADGEDDDVTVTVSLDTQAKGAFTAASLTASGFTDNNDGTYSLTARSPGAATTAIRALVFDPANNRAAAGQTETTTFTISVNDGTSTTPNTTTTVVSTSVNDAPVITSSATQSIAENTTAVATLTATDADPSTTLTWSIDGAGADDAKFAINSMTGALRFTSAPNYEAPTDSGDTAGNNTYVVRVKVGDGTTFTTQDVTVTVTGANEAPVLSGTTGNTWVEGSNSGVDYSGDTVLLFSGVTLADPDTTTSFDGATFTVALSAYRSGDLVSFMGSLGAVTYDQPAGTVSVSGTTVGSVAGGYEEAMVITFNSSATAASIAQVINAAAFTIYANDNPTADTRTITATFNDNANGGAGALTGQLTGNLVVTATNDAPAMTAGASSASYTENGVAAVVDNTIVLTDVDTSTLSGATAVISAGYATGDTLNFTTQNGITGSWNAATQTLTLSGNASVADYQTALRSVTFSSTSDNPGSATRTVTWQVNDGQGASNLSNQPTSTVAVVPVNDAPVLANLNGDTVNFSVGGTAVMIDAGGNATLADADHANFSGGSVTVSITANGVAAEDVLGVEHQGSGAGQIGVSGATVTYAGTAIGTLSGGTGGADLVISLNANATPAAVQALVRALSYADTDANTTNTTARTIRVTVNDGQATSADSDVTLTLVRAPIIDLDGDNSSGGTGSSYSGSFTEGGGAVAIIDGDATLSDDGATLNQAVITLTTPQAGDVLTLSGGARTVNGITVTYTSDSVITLSGTGTKADYLALLSEARFNNGSDAPDTTTRTITFQGRDTDNHTGTVATASVAVTAVNDAPALSADMTLAPVAEDAASPAGGTIAALAGQVTFTDPDASSSLGGFAITGNAANALTEGVWQYSTDGTTWHAVGTVNDGASALALSAATKLRFVPVADYNGTPGALSVRALDNSYSAGWTDGATRVNVDTTTNGGTTAIAATARLVGTSVSAVNDAPTASVSAGSSIFLPGGGEVAVDGALTLGDVDNTHLNQAIITLSPRPDGSAEQLTLTAAAQTAATNAGLVVTAYDAATGQLTISGNATVADYQAVLRGVLYGNSAAAPDSTARTLSLVVRDTANASSTPVNRTVQIDTPPQVGGAQAGQALTDKGTATPFAAVTISDGNASQIQTVTVTLDNAAKGRFTTLAGFTDNNDGSYTFTGTAAQAQAAIRQLVFSPPQNRGTVGSTETTTFTVTVNDGVNTAATDATTTTVVHSINDAPTATGPLTGAKWGGSGGTLTIPATAFTDVDPGTTLTWSASGTPPWMQFDPATQTLSGTPPAGSSGTALVTIQVNDGQGGTATQTVTMTWDHPAPSASPPPPPAPPAPPPPQAGSPGDAARLVTVVDRQQGGAFVSPALGNAGLGNAGLGNAGLGDALVTMKPVMVIEPAGQQINFTLPTDVFAYGNDVQVQLAAVLADGTALPGWLSFNPETGTFVGQPPAGLTGEVVVRVIARDQQGREAIATVRINLGGGDGAGAGLPQGQDGAPRAPGQRGDLMPDATEPAVTLSESGKGQAFAGKPTFQDQLRMASRLSGARQAQLLAAARAVSSKA